MFMKLSLVSISVNIFIWKIRLLIQFSARSHVFITDDRNVPQMLLRPVCASTRKHIVREYSLFFEPSILYVKLYYNFTQ